MPTPSLNRFQRMHFRARARLRDQYVRIFRLHATAVTRARQHQYKHVYVTRYGPRELDFDNLVGGCKPLVDALFRAGLIWDDSPRYVHIEYEQQRTPAKRSKTIVRIS
jgi:hypothetical protein